MNYSMAKTRIDAVPFHQAHLPGLILIFGLRLLIRLASGYKENKES